MGGRPVARIGLLRLQSLEGSPITVGETTLTPQAQLVSLGRRRARVTPKGFGGWGWVRGLLIPRAIIEERKGRTRRLAIPDRTGQALLTMAILALAVALLSILVQMLIQPLAAGAKGD